MKTRHVPVVGKRPRSVARKTVQRKATTFRFAPQVQQRLELLCKLRKTPLNRLVNAAVAQYVEIGLAEAEQNLTETLHRIRATRQADPNFESAIAELVDAEVALAASDPVEGRPLEPKPLHQKAAKAGSAQAKVHQVLRA